MRPPPAGRAGSGIRRRTASAVAWAVLLGAGALLTVAVVAPRVAGATPHAVLTGSMRPTLPPGTLVVVRPVAPEDVRIGSVITYQRRSGEPTLVTHRVVGVAVDGHGERRFTTKGDANEAVDRLPVRPVQLTGELWYSVPHVGFVQRYVSQEQRHRATVAVAVTLFAYAAWVLTSAGLPRLVRPYAPDGRGAR